MKEERKIRLPDNFEPKPKSSSIPEFSFPMTGAEVFANVCKAEGLAALFCCPGNYSLVKAILKQGIPCYSGRHEGSMAAAADAFTRMTGELAACSGTEGPGLTNMITSIAAAGAARTPLLILASNHFIGGDDTEAYIQGIYQQRLTEGFKKFGKRILSTKRIHDYAAYAFRKLRTGVPRPVHLDFPFEVYEGKVNSEKDLAYYYSKAQYRTEAKICPDPIFIDRARDLINSAKRPMIVSSTGVFYSKGWQALRRLAEKAQIAVVESGPMRGQFPDDHELSASRAPGCLSKVDLVIYVGQYCMPTLDQYAFPRTAKFVRIDPDAEDVGRNVPVDLGIIANEDVTLSMLADAVPSTDRRDWIAEIAEARTAFDRQNDEYYRMALRYEEGIHPAVISQGIADLMETSPEMRMAPIVQGGFGVARYTRRWLQARRPGQILNAAYQYGAIGLEIPYTLGFGIAAREGVGIQEPYKNLPVICIGGDAGMGICGMEIETLAKYRVPSVFIIYNNNCWGTWEQDMKCPQTSQVHLFQENIRYDVVAQALGGHGEYIVHPSEFLPSLRRCYKLAQESSLPVLMNCQAIKEFWDKERYPPGFIDKVEPGCMSYYH